MRFIPSAAVAIVISFISSASANTETLHDRASVEVGVQSSITGILNVGVSIDISVEIAATKKKVFAHYMVGTTTREHCIQDIQDAKRVGLDGFALNVAVPEADWAMNTVRYLFEYAERVGFYLHIFMDIGASQVDGRGAPSRFIPMLRKYVDSSAYYKVNSKNPMINAYRTGSLNETEWASWKASALTSKYPMYFCPTFDETPNYYNATDAWWAQWGGVADCIFSWDSVWQKRPGFEGSAGPGSTELDESAIAGSSVRGKGYTMGLSSLQFKAAYGTNLFRPGGLTLINRMIAILGMNIQPNAVQIISWNDGPEGHYIGNNWAEQNGDSAVALYVTPEPHSNTTHRGYQPLIWSFADAWRRGKGPSQMRTPKSEPVVGAIWYKRVLQASNCTLENRPNNWQADEDTLYWAVVVNPALDPSYWSLRIVSGGKVTVINDLTGGLNYGVVTAYAGAQRMELHHKFGARPMVAQGGFCISLDCPNDLYNMNPVVRELKWERTVDYPVCSCPDGSLLVDSRCVKTSPSLELIVEIDAGIRLLTEQVTISISDLLNL